MDGQLPRLAVHRMEPGVDKDGNSVVSFSPFDIEHRVTFSVTGITDNGETIVEVPHSEDNPRPIKYRGQKIILYKQYKYLD